MEQIHSLYLHEAQMTDFMTSLNQFPGNFPKKMKDTIGEDMYEKLGTICV
jgi:hypothetical protein